MLKYFEEEKEKGYIVESENHILVYYISDNSNFFIKLKKTY